MLVPDVWEWLGRYKWFILAVLVLALAVWANGDEVPGLSLAQARQLALERNTDYRTAEIQVNAAVAQLRVAREYPNPVLSLSTAKISTDDTPEGTPMGNSLLNRSYDSIVSLSQLIQVAKRGLLRDAATAGVHAAQSQQDDARRLLVESVTQAYVAALAAREEVAVLDRSAVDLRREADIAAERLKAGDLSASDRAQIEIAAEQDELGAESARAAGQAAVVALELVLGEPNPNGGTQLSDTLDTLGAAAAPGLEEATVGRRPDIVAAEDAVSQAETNLRLQKRERIPDVTVSAQFERNPPAQPNTAGVGVSLPLPLWNRNKGEILGAQSALDLAQLQLTQARMKASADVASARIAYHEAAGRNRRYRESLVPQSAMATQSVSYAFEKGGASLVDLLEAERNDNAIRVAAVQAHADAAAAAAGLLAALGRSEPAP